MEPTLMKVHATRSGTLRRTAIAAAALVVAFGVVYYAYEPTLSPARVLGKPSLVPDVMSLGKDEPAPTEPMLTPEEETRKLMATRWSAPSLKSEIARLSRGTPLEKLKAYALMEPCLEVKAHPVLAFEKSQRCGDIEQGQMAGRVELLKDAAEIGAPQAYWKLNMEAQGYYDEGQLPNTAVTWQMLERLRVIAVAHGDAIALQTEMPKLKYSDKPEDRATALSYQVAFLINSAKDRGVLPPADVMANGLASDLAKGLPAADVARAVEQGKQLASKSPR